MDTKRQQAINLWKEGKRKKALAIFSTFKIGLSDLEQGCLKMAYEMYEDPRQEKFYKDVGLDTKKIASDAIELIETKFINN